MCLPAPAWRSIGVQFADGVTRAVEAQPLVRIVREEVTDIPSDLTILATGPLTSPALSAALQRVPGT